ncbi:MAG: DUF2891 domain-containing protein [Acidobacteria bacterium]|nr:DUF2891 domain-containing protein [Acidobacteriota bacterium]
MPALTLPLALLFAPAMITTNPDGSARLTLDGAAHLASLPMKCLHQEYPNKTGHTIETAEDAVRTPKQLHPAFYGCFDWHSSVHGHWMLVRLLKQHPNLPKSAEIRRMLDESFQPAHLAAEVDYFNKYKLAKSFERTYGWGWLLKLDEELFTWNDAQARQWHRALQPLTAKVVELWSAFLPKQTYPNRTGVHPNSAFAMVFAIDWARTVKNNTFGDLVTQRARYYFLNNTNAPAILEPDGSDFLSPSMEVSDLMRRILPREEFAAWFTKFLTAEGLVNVLRPPVVSDRTDYQIVHLDGLMLSRAWCAKGIASALPAPDPRRAQLLKASHDLIATALPHVASGEYGGEHWLASFAVYALV